MKVQYLNEQWVEIVPETSSETSKLMKFPAFNRAGPRMLVVNKHLVVKNLVKRLRDRFPNVRVDERLGHMIRDPVKLLQLPEWFYYHTSPKKHQDICLRFLWTVRNAGLLLEPGMGKTKIYLDYLYLLQVNRAAVICPKALLFTWEDEILTHRPELSFHVVQSTDWHAELPGIKAANVSVFNYDKAVRLEHGIAEVKWDSVNVDEGLIKDPSTERTKSLTRLSKIIPNRVLNSGTLINNSALDMFAPVRFLEPSLVGEMSSSFHGEYAVTKKTKEGREVIVACKNVEEMRDTLEACCIVMTKEEWLDLPSKTFHIVDVEVSSEQQRVFDELQSQMAARIDDKVVEVPTPLVLAAKQMQVAGGFLYYVPGGGLCSEEIDGYALSSYWSPKDKAKPKAKREVIFFEDQPKVRKLIQLLQGDLHGRRLIVWYNLQAERALIEEALDGAGISYSTIAGGEKNTGHKVRDFNNSTTRVLLCQAKAVNYGVTVLGNNSDEDLDPSCVLPTVDSQVFTQVFYSLNFSLEVFLQQQDRIHRIGQDRDCEYYLLLTHLDVERYVYKVLGKKLSVKNSMMVDFVSNRAIEV